jgi:EAL domain-containing protein (putative c-di-GMP-specific phosphodiesterase class I)
MRWQAEYHLPDGFKITVNLSRRQLLDPHIVDDIARVLEDTGCEPRALVIDITETVFVADTADLSERLGKIRSFGVTIAMDDFGTGYSSLDQLRHLPIDILKIDESFVTGIADRTEDFDLATAIVKLANSLKLRTLAEGVETPEQLAHLRALNVGYAQGCLFAPALPAKDVERAWQRS